MREHQSRLGTSLGQFLVKLGIGMRAKLIIIFLVVKVLPLVLLTVFAWQQINLLGDVLRQIAVEDASEALNNSAVENIERMTTNTAHEVADFLYGRDADILYLATLVPTEENYRHFGELKTGYLVVPGEWVLAEDGMSWVPAEEAPSGRGGGHSTNSENNDRGGFRYRPPEKFTYANVPLYDEITFVDLSGQEQVKVVTDSTKTHHPLDTWLRDVSVRENTYVKAETYFEQLRHLQPGDIYVSDVIGAYTPSNYIGMYTPQTVAEAAAERGYDIDYKPQEQSYAGRENPTGQRFEGIIRWATPVTDTEGNVIGYVTFALNHDHIMEFVDHLTPMNERYTELPSAYEGNYAFIWDYQCRNISHPRHHSIVGYDPATGEAQVPWLESSIYEAWQASDTPIWTDFLAAEEWPLFDKQSRDKTPASELTQAGLVGLDGRWLNNAPQCIGWMDLTEDGGSGSFYILWSGLYKLTTAATIPYYTGQYAPSENNNYSQRGFGFVTIGAGLEDFAQPATEMQQHLTMAVEESLSATSGQLVAIAAVLIVLVVLTAFLIAYWLTGSIQKLIKGISRFRAGERQFRFNAPVKNEFGTLADSFDEMADSIEDSVKNPLSIVDMDHNIIYMNEPGLKFCNLTLDTAVGSSYDSSSIYPPNSIYSPITALEEGHEAEVIYMKEGQCYLKGRASHFVSREGEKLGYIIETMDVTELNKARLELERAKKDAEAASAHKGEFLARMSHEIRTPMNAIIGVAGIIQKRIEARQADGTCENNPMLQEIKSHIGQIDTSSQHLLGLLNDILDITKIEAGKIELAMESIDLSRLADTVNSIIRGRCDEKNITYVTPIADFGGQLFLSDALRLRQVLINLLGNAVKFTPKGGTITFEISRLEERPEETLIRFSVQDSGIGISEEALGTIFEPFEQEKRKVSRRSGGTGLGLSISHSIVEMLGGELQVSSELDRGSEFSFQFWMCHSDDLIMDSTVLTDITGIFEGKRVLLVDDVEVNRLVVTSMLEETGIQIDEADDGAKAIQMVDASPPGGYDVILMDIQMPQMNGYEASMAIRALDRPDAAVVPIIALTANAFKEDINKAHRNKMNAHVSKPVEIDALLEVLYRFLHE